MKGVHYQDSIETQLDSISLFWKVSKPEICMDSHFSHFTPSSINSTDKAGRKSSPAKTMGLLCFTSSAQVGEGPVFVLETPNTPPHPPSLRERKGPCAWSSTLVCWARTGRIIYECASWRGQLLTELMKLSNANSNDHKTKLDSLNLSCELCSWCLHHSLWSVLQQLHAHKSAVHPFFSQGKTYYLYFRPNWHQKQQHIKRRSRPCQITTARRHGKTNILGNVTQTCWQDADWGSLQQGRWVLLALERPALTRSLNKQTSGFLRAMFSSTVQSWRDHAKKWADRIGAGDREGERNTQRLRVQLQFLE